MRVNIPGLLTSQVGNIKGTIISLNEKQETCSMMFDGGIIKHDIPMNSVYINEGFIDTLKKGFDKVKQTASVVIKKFKGLFVPIIDGVRDMMSAIKIPSNWIELQRQGFIPKKVGFDVCGESNGDAIDKEEENVVAAGIDEFEKYMYKVIKNYDKNPQEGVGAASGKVIAESLISSYSKLNKLNEAGGIFGTNSMVVSITDPTVFGAYQTSVDGGEQLETILQSLYASVLNGYELTSFNGKNDAELQKQSKEEFDAIYNAVNYANKHSQQNESLTYNKKHKLNEARTFVSARDFSSYDEIGDNALTDDTPNEFDSELIDFDDLYTQLNIVSESNYKQPIIHSGNQQPILLWGAPGIGKTSIIKQSIEDWNEKYPKQKLSLIVVDVGTCRASDLILPNIEDAKQVVNEAKNGSKKKEDILDKNTKRYKKAMDTGTFDQYTASWLPVVDTNRCNSKEERFLLEKAVNKGMVKSVSRKYLAAGTDASDDLLADDDIVKNREDYWGGVLFLDEITRISDQGLRTFIMNLVCGRQFNGKVLASNWIVIAASNRVYDVTPNVLKGMQMIMGESAQLSRFRHINFTMSFKEWFKYAKTVLDPIIVNFFEELPDDNLREQIYYPTIANGGFEKQLKAIEQYSEQYGGNSNAPLANNGKQSQTTQGKGKGITEILRKMREIRQSVTEMSSAKQGMTTADLLKQLGLTDTNVSTTLTNLITQTDIKSVNGRTWVDSINTELKRLRVAINTDRENIPIWDDDTIISEKPIIENNKKVGTLKFKVGDLVLNLLDEKTVTKLCKNVKSFAEWVKLIYSQYPNIFEETKFVVLNNDIAKAAMTTWRYIEGKHNNITEGRGSNSGLIWNKDKVSQSMRLVHDAVKNANEVLNHYGLSEQKYSEGGILKKTTKQIKMENNLRSMYIALAVYAAVTDPEFNYYEFVDEYFGFVVLADYINPYSTAAQAWKDNKSWKGMFKSDVLESLVRYGYYPVSGVQPDNFGINIQEAIDKMLNNINNSLPTDGNAASALASFESLSDVMLGKNNQKSASKVEEEAANNDESQSSYDKAKPYYNIVDNLVGVTDCTATSAFSKSIKDANFKTAVEQFNWKISRNIITQQLFPMLIQTFAKMYGSEITDSPLQENENLTEIEVDTKTVQTPKRRNTKKGQQQEPTTATTATVLTQSTINDFVHSGEYILSFANDFAVEAFDKMRDYRERIVKNSSIDLTQKEIEATKDIIATVETDKPQDNNSLPKKVKTSNSKEDEITIIDAFKYEFYKAFNSLNTVIKQQCADTFRVNKVTYTANGEWKIEKGAKINLTAINGNVFDSKYYDIKGQESPILKKEYADWLTVDAFAEIIAKLNTHMFNLSNKGKSDRMEGTNNTIEYFNAHKPNNPEVLTVDKMKQIIEAVKSHDTVNEKALSNFNIGGEEGNLFWRAFKTKQGGNMTIVLNRNSNKVSECSLLQIVTCAKMAIMMKELNEHTSFWKCIVNIWTLMYKYYAEAVNEEFNTNGGTSDITGQTFTIGEVLTKVTGNPKISSAYIFGRNSSNPKIETTLQFMYDAFLVKILHAYTHEMKGNVFERNEMPEA